MHSESISILFEFRLKVGLGIHIFLDQVQNVEYQISYLDLIRRTRNEGIASNDTCHSKFVVS